MGTSYFASVAVLPHAAGAFNALNITTGSVIIDENGQPRMGTPAAGELALVPPFLGGSNTLLNRDHHEAAYLTAPCRSVPYCAALGACALPAVAGLCAMPVLSMPCRSAAHVGPC